MKINDPVWPRAAKGAKEPVEPATVVRDAPWTASASALTQSTRPHAIDAT